MGYLRESVWIVRTARVETAMSTYGKVAALVDANDKIFVADVTEDAMAWTNLAPDVSAWIRAHYSGS